MNISEIDSLEDKVQQLIKQHDVLTDRISTLTNHLTVIEERMDHNEQSILSVHESVSYGHSSDLYEDEEYNDLVNQTQPTLITDQPDSNLDDDLQGFSPNEESGASPEIKSLDSSLSSTKKMTIWQHLEDLRWVLFKSMVTLIITVGIGFSTTDFISKLLFHPIRELIDSGKVQVIYNTPTAAFFVQLKMAFLTGLILSLPFILYFIWRFITPALKKSEIRYVRGAFFIGFGCFLIGASLGYGFLHEGIPILLGFSMESVSNLWPLASYIGFCTKLILAFGIVFEMPILFGILAMLGVTKASSLAKLRPYALIIILITAALLTPPDVFSQLALGGPMYLLYEISILVTRRIENKKLKASKEN